MFTKLLKPVVAALRIRTILYLDDTLHHGELQGEATETPSLSLKILIALGFIVNLRKSVFTPSRELEFLGFLLNSTKLSISLPKAKIHALMRLAQHMLNQQRVTLRDLSRIFGTMVAVHPAILPAPLHYQIYGAQKGLGIRDYGGGNRGNEVRSQMVDSRCQSAQWKGSGNHTMGPHDRVGHLQNGVGSVLSGLWSVQERSHTINYLKLLAAFLALQTFASKLTTVAILLLLDNVTAIAYIYKMGHSDALSLLAVEIWSWCLVRNLIIHTEHLPGRENICADWESRHTADSSDWRLNQGVFRKLDEKFGPFTIDLFPSRTNHQVEIYCSWRPDPTAWAVDALSVSWKGFNLYMFPPFAVIPRCMNKLRVEGGLSTADCTHVAKSGLVSTVVGISSGLSNSSTPPSEHNHECTRSKSPSSVRRPPTLSDGVIEIISKSWRVSTESYVLVF